jgi:hypothetical protein
MIRNFEDCYMNFIAAVERVCRTIELDRLNLRCLASEVE